MQYIVFQDIEMPALYVTGLSYSKSCRLHTTSTGFARFLGYNPAEISLRLYIDSARAAVCGRDFAQDFYLLSSLRVDAESEPSQVIYAEHILYPALAFRMTSITTTTEMDSSGLPVAIEADVTLSGCRCVKGEVGRQALVFTEDYTIPEVSILCKGQRLSLGVDTTVSGLVLTPGAAEAEVLIGDDRSVVQDAPWLLALVQNEAQLHVDGYGSFCIVAADLVEGVLSLKCSKWGRPHDETSTYTSTTLNAILSDISGHYADVSGKVDYYRREGTETQAVSELQSSAGFLIHYAQETVSFRAVPEAIVPDVDIDLYIDSDLATEVITGIVWRSPGAVYTVGSNPSVQVESAFSSPDADAARSCLKYMQYMQNSIKLVSAIDKRIKHHSALYVIKDTQAIPCMVESYRIDFLSGQMELDLHYISR